MKMLMMVTHKMGIHRMGVMRSNLRGFGKLLETARKILLEVSDPQQKVKITNDFDENIFVQESIPQFCTYKNENTKHDDIGSGSDNGRDYGGGDDDDGGVQRYDHSLFHLECPKRPEKPQLLDMKEIKHDKSIPLPISILHNCAHIELNAINACWHTMSLPFLLPNQKQTQTLPTQFFSDFLSIAKDEARHFEMLSNRLLELGSYYGAIASHNSLWNAVFESRHSLLERICITQLVLEGRGLDSGPRLKNKLISCNDKKSYAIMKQIVEEEVQHVSIGIKWFKWICQNQLHISDDNEQGKVYSEIVNKYFGKLPTPFNVEARNKAQFPEKWYKSVATH